MIITIICGLDTPLGLLYVCHVITVELNDLRPRNLARLFILRWPYLS